MLRKRRVELSHERREIGFDGGAGAGNAFEEDRSVRREENVRRDEVRPDRMKAEGRSLGPRFHAQVSQPVGVQPGRVAGGAHFHLVVRGPKGAAPQAHAIVGAAGGHQAEADEEDHESAHMLRCNLPMDALSPLKEDPSTTGIFLDFDGTLSPIVDRPDDAVPVAGAAEVLESLASTYKLVAVISGRPLEFLKSRLPRTRVLLCGAYGRERSDRTGRRMTEGWEPVAAAAVAATAHLGGVIVERKGAGVALHYRSAPERGSEVHELAVILAEEFELEIMPGRLVAELVFPGPKKGDALAGLVREKSLRSVLVAGDDLADVEAFEVARTLDVHSLTIAVLSEEAPERLIESADATVSGPSELVGLLEELL